MDLAVFQQNEIYKNKQRGTSVVIQWLRFHIPKAEGPGSIPGQGTRSHVRQLRPGEAKHNEFFKVVSLISLKSSALICSFAR